MASAKKGPSKQVKRNVSGFAAMTKNLQRGAQQRASQAGRSAR